MDKCRRCTNLTTEFLVASYTERHGIAPSKEKIADLATEAAEICFSEGEERGWIKEVTGK